MPIWVLYSCIGPTTLGVQRCEQCIESGCGEDVYIGYNNTDSCIGSAKSGEVFSSPCEHMACTASVVGLTGAGSPVLVVLATIRTPEPTGGASQHRLAHGRSAAAHRVLESANAAVLGLLVRIRNFYELPA